MGSVWFASLEDVAVASDVLLPEESVVLESRLLYSNLAKYSEALWHHAAQHLYIPRRAHVHAVKLYRLPRETTICGGAEYVVRSGDAFIREQFSSEFVLSDEDLSAMGEGWAKRPVESRECLIVGRYGIFTWGHWIGELLPKVVLAEKLYPGRFRYILPRDILRDDRPGEPSLRMRESLEAYSVPMDSIYGFSGELDTRFENLYAVGDIWSDNIMHPAAIDWMRHAVQVGRPPAGLRQLAIERMAGTGRAIENWGDVEGVLARRGFTTVATGALPFADQVAIFQSAETVFGTLGSDLTNLIYAPKGVRVVAAAPVEFGDLFFYALVQDRDGYFADLRGPVTQVNQRMASKSRFRLDLEDLDDALQRAEAYATIENRAEWWPKARSGAAA